MEFVDWWFWEMGIHWGACGGGMSWRERCVLVDGEGLFFFFVGLRWDGMGLGFCLGWALGMGVRV